MPFDVTLGTTNERTTNALLFLQTECHKNAFTFAQIQIWMHKLCIKVHIIYSFINYTYILFGIKSIYIHMVKDSLICNIGRNQINARIAMLLTSCNAKSI